MSTSLPYLSTPGVLPKILTKICEATVPESFNTDFLGTKLGFPGGNQRMFISWAKKCGLLNSDGTPTQVYKDFRNPNYRGASLATALRKGYSEIYTRNEYAHDLSRPEFTKLVSETTGWAHDNSTVKAIVGTYFSAKAFADFEIKSNDAVDKEEPAKEQKDKEKVVFDGEDERSVKRLNLGLSYTINLVLPKTDDPSIYNAIFKSLKENLLND